VARVGVPGSLFRSLLTYPARTAVNIPANDLVHFTVYDFANRAGLLAFASLPFTVLLSTKVSLVAFITGISYDRLMYLHKWVARCTLSLAIIHSCVKLSNSHDFSVFSYRTFGLLTFLMAATMLLFNQRWSMRYFYELFFYVHAILVV
jgi:ferric-chelate reductase